MKVSRNWLRKLTTLPEKDELLVEKIGAQLGAVDVVIDYGKRFHSLQAVKVVSCQKHPNADNLQVCNIDTGGTAAHINLANEQGHIQVVCGAPNVAAGQIAVWVPPGAIVPNTAGGDEFRIETREIRGIKSHGMLASPHELGFSEDHQGILLLPTDTAPGTPLSEIYELNDIIIDIENKMFTHRPDCFGMLGVAREVAGITGTAFHSPDWYLQPIELLTGEDSLPLEINNSANKLTPRFIAAAIKGVQIKSSPVSLQSYLSRLGVKPINNVVDITNYYMLLTGQPLHAYDYDKLKAIDGSDNQVPCLTIRAAVDGEQLRLLGGKHVKLLSSDIVIASRTRPVGLGGIMGGADTEVDASTKNIVLECANFDMYATRRTAMRLGLFTEAATRFTKHQSPLQNDRVFHKVAQDILKSANGQLASKVYDETANKLPPLGSVQTTASFISDRLGLKLSPEDVASKLRNVEFNVAVEEENLRIDAPFWRTDIHIEEDIVEEVGRLIGYDHLSVELPQRSIKPAPKNEWLEMKDSIRDILRRAGGNEVLTYSFVHGGLLEKTGQDPKLAFQLSNALSPDLQFYRLSLTPSLLEKLVANHKAGFREFVLFELNKTHCKQELGEDDLPLESERVAAVCTMQAEEPAKGGAPYYQAKYLLEFLLKQLGVKTPKWIALSDYIPNVGNEMQLLAPYEPRRAAVLTINDGQMLGVVGEFAMNARRQLKLPSHSSGFEVYLSSLKEGKSSDLYVPLSRFPSAEQDISFRVKPEVSFGELTHTMQGGLIKAQADHGYSFVMTPLDIYLSDDRQEKHVAFRIRLTHAQRTLTTDETNRLLESLAADMQQIHHAERL